jgi:hypothetical protein
VVVGVFATAVLLRDDGGDTTAADRDRTPKTDAPAAGAADEETTEAAPLELGDIGEISDPAVLRERLAQPAPSPQPSTDAGPADLFAACAFTGEQLGIDGPFNLVATGTYEGAPASVIVAPKNGVDTAFVVDNACEVRSEVPLV